MRFLSHMRSKSKLKSQDAAPEAYIYPRHEPQASYRSGIAANLPKNVLDTIFAYVCPHALDETYVSCEDSPLGDECMLCDMRDLAHCSVVCENWSQVAQRVL